LLKALQHSVSKPLREPGESNGPTFRGCREGSQTWPINQITLYPVTGPSRPARPTCRDQLKTTNPPLHHGDSHLGRRRTAFCFDLQESPRSPRICPSSPGAKDDACLITEKRIAAACAWRTRNGLATSKRSHLPLYQTIEVDISRLP
jgi:hypothetical protein